MLQVIKRHIKSGFRLLSIEKYVNGSRIDLEFLRPDGGLRINEVKSKRELGEVDRIQAALYSDGSRSYEVVVSSRATDVVLPSEYVEEIHRRAEATRIFLLDHPDLAANSFNPNADICRTCANNHCPFLPKEQC
jgi:hypothetical protein